MIVSIHEVEENIRSKLREFNELFRQRTQSTNGPDFVVCAPGRVNLIGDHIDYHGFSVLPMAIGNSVWLACRLGESEKVNCQPEIKFNNTDESKFPNWSGKHSFRYGSELCKAHLWHNYLLCGYHGVLTSDLLHQPAHKSLENSRQISSDKLQLEILDERLEGLADLVILVGGNLPHASGLSSSSSLVCASAVATKILLRHRDVGGLLKMDIDCNKLAEDCSKFEHLVGTQGGGMDQAVIMTAQEGYAKYVSFVPSLQCQNTQLPEDVVWLVAHCGHECAKASTSGFNTRVLETKLAAAMIVSTMKREVPNLGSITLRQIKEEIFSGLDSPSILDILEREVFSHKRQWTIDEICDRLDLSRSSLIETFRISETFLGEISLINLKLMDRVEHILTEAERVEKFRSICEDSNDIIRLGKLMSQSHFSLRDKYECSHPALDKLVDVALEAGALGSRLTGAGWGGCTVSLVEREKSANVERRLNEISRFTFKTEPRGGCRVIVNDHSS